jgi:PhnB protein
MASINPYLGFNDECAQAFDFYKSVFGGEFTTKMKFGEVPAEYQAGPGENEKIMHMALPIGKNSVLMGSDRPSQMGKGTQGSAYTVSIQAESEQEADKLFQGLSAGGTVTMPLTKAFWGAYFGMFVDKFGIQWMVNYEYPKQK